MLDNLEGINEVDGSWREVKIVLKQEEDDCENDKVFSFCVNIYLFFILEVFII